MGRIIIEPTIKEWQAILQKEKIALLYVSNTACSTCQVDWKHISSYGSDFVVGFSTAQVTPDLAAQNLVFAAPTVLLFCHGKEVWRESQFIDFRRLEEKIQTFHTEA